MLEQQLVKHLLKGCNLISKHICEKSVGWKSLTRGHDYKLTVPFTRIDPYKFSFFPATIALWNKLPTEIVNATSIDSFTYLLKATPSQTLVSGHPPAW